jgi:O-antigen/teichoic acid export membrane protein
VRAGLWVFPLVWLGFFDPAYRTAAWIVVFWGAGVGVSLVLALWGWHGLPWREGMRRPVDWAWLRAGLGKSSFIWISNLALACGVFVDRFVAAHFLNMEAAGLVTFYTSFTMALASLLQSGILAFTGPRLVLFWKKGEKVAFAAEMRRAGKQVRWGLAGMALAVGLLVPCFGWLIERPLYYEKAWFLALLLLGVWLRGWADLYYCSLFARHQDRALWLGDALYLLPAFLGNLLLAPFFGLAGIGISSVLAALFLLAWRALKTGAGSAGDDAAGSGLGRIA